MASSPPSLSLQAMSYHIVVWKICGLWDLPGRPVWYTIYSGIIYIVFYFLYPLCIALQLLFTASFDEMIDILLILPTALAGVKGFFVILKRRQLRALFALIERMDAEHVLGADHHRMVDAQVRGSRLLVQVLSAFYYSTVVASFMVAYLSEERRFMWQSYYPFDYQHNLGVYYFFLLFQLVASFLVSFIYSSLDLYGSALYRVLGAHIDILAQRMEALGVRPLVPTSMVDRIPRVRPGDLDAVAACADYHNMCIQYSSMLNNILSIHFLFQFGTSGLVFCGSEFKISTLDPVEQFTDFLFIFMYIVSMTYQIFIPCYFGSIVKAKSEQLPLGVFAANWLENDRPFRTAITILGERVKRPITPFAGGLFAVGLPTFVSIMKSAYSLMAFLKNMESRQ